MSFHCWTFALKGKRKSSRKPAPWWSISLQMIKHPQSCVLYFQRSRCFFQVHSTSPREVRMASGSVDTRGNGPKPAALVGIKRETALQILQPVWTGDSYFSLGLRKLLLVGMMEIKSDFPTEMRAAWRSSWPLTWCPKCYRNSHKYHF